jgi:RNA polymerase sigma-70 factor, ECF subfamily
MVETSKTRWTMQSNSGEPFANVDDHSSKTFSEFYSCHIARVYRYILTNVGDSQVAQDLTSESFLVALKNFHRYRGEGSPSAWLLGIARHKVKDYFRSRQNPLPLESVISIASITPSPEELAEQRFQIAQVTKALRALSPNRADALVLHTFAGLSVGEIGQILGKSDGAVKLLIYRAVQDLKMFLAPEKEGLKNGQE